MSGSADKAAMRELMRQHREAQGKAKISDPLARYSPAGELFCVLCNTPVKSERVWTAHVQGRAHKQQLQALRSRSSAATAPASLPSSSAPPAAVSSSGKSLNGSSASTSSSQSQKRKFTALVQDYGDDDSDDENDSPDTESAGKRLKVDNGGSSTVSSKASNLPTGFFDSGVQQSSTPAVEVPGAPSSAAAAGKAQVEETKTIEEKLPEGFFDDLKQDAKARKVEYVDPQQAEYEKFQQAILKANQESEVLMDQDDDEAQDQRHYMELNESLANAQRVDTLQEVMQRKLMEARSARQTAKDEDMSAQSGSSDDDDMFDWRAKKLAKKAS